MNFLGKTGVKVSRLALGAMIYKRQIKEIQFTDRSFITTSDYTPFTVAMPAETARQWLLALHGPILTPILAVLRRRA